MPGMGERRRGEAHWRRAPPIYVETHDGEEGRWVEVGDDCGSFVSGGKICWLLARGDPLTRMFPVFLWCFLGADSS